MPKIKAQRINDVAGSLPDDQDFIEELVLTAENYGDFYRKGDAKGAVEKAYSETKRMLIQSLDKQFAELKAQIIKRVKDGWE